MSGKSLRLVKFYSVPPSKVFNAWTSKEEVKKWFTPQPGMTLPICDIDFRVGGKYRLGFEFPDGSMNGTDGSMPIASGEYLEIIPEEKIVFTWRWESWPMEMAATKVTIELKEKNGGTELTLIHEDLSNDESVQNHTEGWTGCLAGLEKSLS